MNTSEINRLKKIEELTHQVEVLTLEFNQAKEKLLAAKQELAEYRRA